MIASKANKSNRYQSTGKAAANKAPIPIHSEVPKSSQDAESAKAEDRAIFIEDMFEDAAQILKNNLAYYARTSKETGKVDFVGSEIVARMANEGEVLLPDQAERLMKKIHAVSQKVQQFTLRLQATLQSELSYKDCLSEKVRLNLLNLSRETTTLLTAVELHVVPLAELVKVGWESELLKLISGLKNTLDKWIQLLSQEASDLITPQSNRHRSLIYQSTLFSSKVEELRIRSLEIIMNRVPLYRVLG